MHTKRIIPCLDVHAGRVVKGVNFVNLQDAGDPVEIAAAYDAAGADEVDMGTDIAIETLDAAHGAQALDQTLLLEEGQISVHRCNGDIRMICLEHLMEFFR